jgi:hypothetical protein
MLDKNLRILKYKHIVNSDTIVMGMRKKEKKGG